MMRIQRYLAMCGIGSRRRCEEMIALGRVRLNGSVVTEPGTKVLEGDVVEFDGREVWPLVKRYYILNKPPGWICVDRDPRGRKYVLDLIPGSRAEGCFPVGRLDLDTTGLLIITNDGDLANGIAHPSKGVEKTYEATLKGRVDPDRIGPLEKEGAVLEDGSRVEGIRILGIEHRADVTLVVIAIHEGRRHVVKRIFRSIGTRVIALHRSRIGMLDLGTLEQGRSRTSTREEIATFCLRQA